MKKVLIWGTGLYADTFVWVMHKVINVTGYVETKPQLKKHNDLYIFAPDELSQVEYDYLLIVNTHYREIRDLCCLLGIELNKVINVFEQILGLSAPDLSEIDFSGYDKKYGWVYFKELLFCTNNEVLFRSIVKNVDFSAFWIKQQNNVLLQESSLLTMRMNEVFNNWVIPVITPEDELLDIGCSDGFFDEKLAKFCKHIDAYDYSETSIISAKRNALSKGIGNIRYETADAKKIIINKKYNLVLLLGLTIYFEDDAAVQRLVNQIFSSVESGGKVLVKDSLNLFDTQNIFHYNFSNNYQVCYRPVDKYENMWTNAGFKMVNKKVLADDLNIGIIDKQSIIYLFEKE